MVMLAADVDTDADTDGDADDIFPFCLLHTACVIKCLVFANENNSLQ